MGWGAALIVGALVFLAVTLVSAAVFIVSPQSSSVSASFLRAQPGSLRWDGRSRLTVLLIGLQGQGSGAQAEALTVASFDPSRGSITLLSIPPNLWVNVPGYGPARLSDAYGDGGARLQLLTVESVVAVPIPYYAVVRSDTLHQLVDDLGGVTLSLPGTGSRQRAAHLNGARALRYVSSGEIGSVSQMEHQQRLLIALQRQAVQPQTAFRVPSIVNSLGGSMPTNFPYDQVPELVRDLALVPRSHLRATVLSQSNGAVAGGSAGNLLVADWEAIRAVTQRAFPDNGLRREGRVDVLNGNGAPGEAAALADWLRQARIKVGSYGSAASFNYPHTEVVLAPTAASSQARLASTVATLLQAPLVTGHVEKSGADVVVIIGRDYQDISQE